MKYRNKKNGKTYTVIGEVINCTNEQDGQKMYLYKQDECELTFVREINEFNIKFERI